MWMLNISSSCSSRRSHLSSATCQTLVRIFSLCLDDVESLKPSQQQNPNPSPSLDSDANGNSKSERASFTYDSLRLPAGDSTFESGDRKSDEDERLCAHGRMEKGDGFINFDIETELEFDDEGNDDELLPCIITDCVKLIEGSADGSNLLSKDQNGSFGLEKARERTCQEMDINATLSDSIDELKCEQSTRVENVRELGEGTQQEACANSVPFVSEDFRDRNLEDGEVDGKEFEEGEIQDDFDSSNQSLDMVHEKLDERNGLSSSSQGIETFTDDESLKLEKKRWCDDAAVADVGQKVTDSTTNEENGKSSVTEGDLCKFSHDTTPLTKSQPCKYFACNSCLKGDDCPFDHQLSKYPCHNFTSKGMCIRGDRCKFSHKLQVPEDTNAASEASKPDTVPSSRKSNLVRQSCMSRTLLDSDDKCKSAVTSSPRSAIMPNPTAGKYPNQIPNGIHLMAYSFFRLESKRPSNRGKIWRRCLRLHLHTRMFRAWRRDHFLQLNLRRRM